MCMGEGGLKMSFKNEIITFFVLCVIFVILMAGIVFILNFPQDLQKTIEGKEYTCTKYGLIGIYIRDCSNSTHICEVKWISREYVLNGCYEKSKVIK